jgi:hypothetical protein
VTEMRVGMQDRINRGLNKQMNNNKQTINEHTCTTKLSLIIINYAGAYNTGSQGIHNDPNRKVAGAGRDSRFRVCTHKKLACFAL